MPATVEGAWTPGPERPPFLDGAVHVWRADLSAASDELCGLLSSDELARADRLLTAERERALWMRSRGMLRALLGRYMGKDPTILRFGAGAHGKPALLEDSPAPPVERSSTAPAPRTMSFNISHSGEHALYAFAPAVAVGVDVEVPHRPIDAVGIAARMFGELEAARLRELDPASREREFLRSWVRHEAELKCLGVGIGAADMSGSATRPWIGDLELGPGAAGAVAAELQPRELRCWEWPTEGQR